MSGGVLEGYYLDHQDPRKAFMLYEYFIDENGVIYQSYEHRHKAKDGVPLKPLICFDTPEVLSFLDAIQNGQAPYYSRDCVPCGFEKLELAADKEENATPNLMEPVIPAEAKFNPAGRVRFTSTEKIHKEIKLRKSDTVLSCEISLKRDRYTFHTAISTSFTVIKRQCGEKGDLREEAIKRMSEPSSSISTNKILRTYDKKAAKVLRARYRELGGSWRRACIIFGIFSNNSLQKIFGKLEKKHCERVKNKSGNGASSMLYYELAMGTNLTASDSKNSHPVTNETSFNLSCSR